MYRIGANNVGFSTGGTKRLDLSSTIFASSVAITTTDGVTSGTARKVGGTAFVATAASTALSASSTETIFDNSAYNMPADTLKAGTVVRVRFQGIATATNSTDTLQVKLYIGGSTSNLTGTALITTAATDAANNDIFTGEFYLTCRTAGATGTIVGWGNFSEVGAAGGALKSAYVASTTVDTTGALPIKVSGKWSTTSGSNSCRLDVMSVEVIG
jgi:hypothetical protein